MKVTFREFALLILLVIAGWAYISYAYIITPAIDKLSSAQATLDNKQAQERLTHAKIGELPKLAIQESEEFEKAAQATEVFFPDHVEEGIVSFVHDLSVDTGLIITGITSNGAELIDLDKTPGAAARPEQSYLTGRLAKDLSDTEEQAPDEGDTSGTNKQANTTQKGVIANAARAYKLRINFKASEYKHVMAFFKGFEDLGMLSLVNSVSINATAEESLLEGSFSIDLMSIDALLPRDPVFSQPQMLALAGKYDPFVAY